MKKSNTNYLAGIGDPYWYEWSVGLCYALDMLNPDSNIEYVTLQASEFQGLDDVVIKYKDSDAISGVQIKHTRSNDTLTYTDLVLSPEKGKSSLIKKLATDWKNAFSQNKYTSCEVILFTNRRIGRRKSTVNKGTSEELITPPLKEFWNSIQSQLDKVTSLNEIAIVEKWKPAWETLVKELKLLDNDIEILNFLRNLLIKTDQSDLNTIIKEINEKLSHYFGAGEHITTQLDQKLCYALREWTTTLRKSERITREDLYKALSLGQDSSVGDHNLPVCEPFFQSRIAFVEELEGILSSRSYPILFLSGEPGSGKTNIINKLANKSDSVITLRFHAFRPMSPGDMYISADSGVSDSRSFWSDLLLQLRELLVGHLSEYNVPVCNELIESVDTLRSEVLRLAEAYAFLYKKPVVIAIDGIDHAARAGETNNFLNTLIPPEAVSPNICFIIAGQPLQHYDLYPDWLSKCKVVNIPDVKKEDITFLLEAEQVNIDNCPIDIITNVIFRYTNGNTLSTVFAIHECKKIESIEVLEENLTKSKIASGIQSYYEYIWKKGKGCIPDKYSFLDNRLAIVLCMFTKRITARGLKSIYAEYDLPEEFWERLLTTLYPIVIKEDDRYRIFHNDVRIYLENYIKGDSEEFVAICLHLAQFLLESDFDYDMKHEIGFDLLCSAQEANQVVKYFTPEYVIESIKLNRPMREIMGQMETILTNIDENYKFDEWISFSCAVATLHQYLSSLRWRDEKHIEKVVLPPALACEKRIVDRKFLTRDIMKGLFQQVHTLLIYDELVRANKTLERWLGDMSPCDLVHQLSINGNCEYNLQYISQKDIIDILKEWGSLSFFLECDYSFSISKDETCKSILALWNSGRINVSMQSNPVRCFQMINEGDIPTLNEDAEKCFIKLLEKCRAEEIKPLINSERIKKFTKRTKIYWVCWCILNQYCDNCIEELLEILEMQLDYIEIDEFDRYNETNFLCMALIVFILSVYDKIGTDQFDDIVLKALEITKGYKITSSDRGYFSGRNLLVSCGLLGQILPNFLSNNDIHEIREPITMIIESIFDDRDGLGSAEINGRYVKQFLLSAIIFFEEHSSEAIKKLILDEIKYGAHETNYTVTLDIWWKYLVVKGEFAFLKVIFDKWLNNTDGIAWNCELYELHEIADKFIPLSKGLGWDEEILEILGILDNAQVGYIGRKDYSLYRPLEWYRSIESSNINWQETGLLLLNISHYASETGDNRAAIYIDNAIASTVGFYGVNAISRFIDIIKPNNWNEVTIIIDAIIASLEHHKFKEDEILLIWETIVEIANIDHSLPEYNSDNSHKIIYIVHLRTAIITNIHNNTLSDDLLERIQSVAPFEYNLSCGLEAITFILPDRWYNSKTRNKAANKFIEEVNEISCEAAFIRLTEIVEQKGATGRWDAVLGFLYKLEQDNESIDAYLEPIINWILYARNSYSWDYDGVDRLIEKLFSYLSDSHRIRFLQDIWVHHNSNKYDDTIYNLNKDLGNFLYWHNQIISDEEKMSALSRILSTHKLWITAYQKIRFPERYIAITEEEGDMTWRELCNKLIGIIM